MVVGRDGLASEIRLEEVDGVSLVVKSRKLGPTVDDALKKESYGKNQVVQR